MRTAQDFIVEIPVLKYHDQITKARQILRDDRFREIYVVDKKDHLIGYLDLTDGLRVTATKSNVTVEGFIKDAPVVHAGDSIESVAKTMREYRTDQLLSTASPISSGESCCPTSSRSSSRGTSCTARLQNACPER